MALDKASRELFERLSQSRTKPRHEMTPLEARETFAGIPKLVGEGPPVARVEDFEIPVERASILARLFVAQANPEGVLVYLHGGGWVVGSVQEFDALCRELAVRTGYAIIAVNYRKAPEFPFPVPVDDSWTALQWVAEHAERLFGGSLPLLIGGDSAGGNLAIAMTLRARAAGWPRLAAQVLIYPVTDCGMQTPSYLDVANQLSLTKEAMQWYWEHYIPEPATRALPEASPLRVSDCSGLPCAIVLTAEHDVLRDEAEEYVARLRAAGVVVSHQRFTGQMHAFLMMGDVLPGSAAGLEFIRTELSRLKTSFQ